MTTQPIEAHVAEAVPVTLMRIEGMVGGVAKDIASLADKVTDIKAEVTEHRLRISDLRSEMQQVKSDQVGAAKDLRAADKAREDTAAALEKQTADMVAKAKAAVDQSTQRWAPTARFYATLVAIAAVAGTLYYAWVMTH
jgi:chromosome segregation ATPase